MRPKTISLGALLVCSTCVLSAIAQAQGIFVGGTLTNATGMPLTNTALRAESGIVALSDGQGRYAFGVPVGWSGTVTPEKAGWAVTPARRAYTNVLTDVVNQDFVGTPDLPVLAANLSNGVPLLSWLARTGQTYRVEVSRDLKQWDVLGEPVRVETNPAVRVVELEGYRRWFARLAQPAWEYQSATGQVVLPQDSGLDLASLQVLGGQNRSAVTSEGGFQVFEPGSGPALVALMTSNQPVLLGYVGAPGCGVSAQSTANWLLFQAVGGGQLPSSTWAQALGLIHSRPEAQGLAGVISQCVATNPLALVQGEATISNALWVAAGTLVQTNGSPAPPGRARKDDPEDLQAGSFVIEGPYPAQQTGLRCEHNLEGAGLVLVNDYRRHLKYFVYRVGYEDQQGVTHELPEWKRVTGINDYLTGVNGVEGVLSSLTGVMLDQVAYGPSVSSEMRLTVQPENARKVFYRVVVTGPGMKAEVPEVLRTHPLRAGEWATAYQRMQMLEFVKEYFVPWFFAAVPADAVGELWGANAEVGFELVGAASGVGLDLGTTIAANEYAAAGQSLFYALVNDADLREDVLDVARKYGWVTVGEAGVEQLAQLVPSLLSGLGIVDRLIRQMDLALVSDHIARSFPLVYWDVTVLPPRVELEASDRAANGPEAVNLTATVTPMPDLTNSFVKFHWTTSGQGELKHQAGAIVKEGTDFEVVVTNGSCTVSYQNRSDATHGATETVRVAVKRVDAGVEEVREVLVGEGTNQLFVINVAAALKPAETNLLIGEQAVLTLKLEPAEPKGLSNVVYTWTLDGSSGSLSGTDDLQRSYRAAAHGWDVVKVAVKGDYGGKTYALTETKADLKVVPVRVTLKPNGQSMGQDRVLTLTAKVEPEPAEGELVYRWQNSGPAGELVGGNDQQTTWPTNQFRSSATGEGTNHVSVTAYLVTATETNELGQARTDIVVQRSLEFPGFATAFLVLDHSTNAQMPVVVYGSWSDGLNYNLAPGNGTLQGPFSLAPARKFYGHLIEGDWNGDGGNDFVTAYAWWEETSPDESTWFWRLESWTQNDTNGFAATTVWQGHGNPLQLLAAGDLDVDGDPDLCVVYRALTGGPWDNGYSAVARFINDGQGRFTRASDIELPWQYRDGVAGMVLADVDSTNGVDLILGCSVSVLSPWNEHNGKHFLIFKNRGDGTFAAAVRQETTHPWIVQAADLNGDGQPDLLAGDESAQGGFLLNDGHGAWPSFVPYIAPFDGEITTVSPADLDGDGDLDLVLGGRTRVTMDDPDGAVFVLRNRGDGSFDPPDIYPKPGAPFLFFQTGVGLIDIDRDGDLDAIVFDESGNRILLNTGDGTF